MTTFVLLVLLKSGLYQVVPTFATSMEDCEHSARHVVETLTPKYKDSLVIGIVGATCVRVNSEDIARIQRLEALK